MNDLEYTIRAKAIETLVKNNCSDLSPEAIEAQGRWLLALWQAWSTESYTIKDFAQLFLDGCSAVGTVEEEAAKLLEDEDLACDFLDFLHTQ
jgi:hypothetical protein